MVASAPSPSFTLGSLPTMTAPPQRLPVEGGDTGTGAMAPVARSPLPVLSAAPAVSPAPLPRALGRVGRDLLPVARFSDLRVIGQLGLTYVLCEGAGELVIIDQHAAHERITLFKLMTNERAQLGGGQILLTPQVIELTPARAAVLSSRTQVLSRYGLEIEPFGGAAMIIKQVPESLMGADLQRLVEDVADDLAAGGDGEPARDLIEKLLATMACHNSIRAGKSLSVYEMRQLLSSLDQVDFSVCAHGRPVSIRVTPSELERRFHRA